MENLVGVPPQQVLLHGPSKLLVHEYHWHQPEAAIVGSYTPGAKDVLDHFGVFRGVDQIEAFGLATIGSCLPFLEAKKQDCSLADLRHKYTPTFISLGQVNFHHYLLEGDTFISIGHIKFYKFRQMTADGRIYKVPKGLDLNAFFAGMNLEQLLHYELRPDFTLVAEIFDITGRAIKTTN